MTRLGLSEEEIRSMTIHKFFRLYRQYKLTFDLESQMKLKGLTYRELERPKTIDDLLF